MDWSGLTAGSAANVIISRTVVTVALVIALLSRSRRWDWVALAVVAGAYAMRLLTQLVS
jgi:hypothetical protein